MPISKKSWVIVLLGCTFLISSCKQIGFRTLDVTSRNQANEQTAHEVLTQIQVALHAYYQEKHHYPATTEVHLYDSIRNFLNPSLDPIHLYRNDVGKGYYIAVGNRASRIIYRYPPTVGAGDYTLYWVGLNGIDEEAEGDDIDAWESSQTRRLERQRMERMNPDLVDMDFVVYETGSDLFKDSMKFAVQQNDSTVYRDTWPLTNYFKLRPELTESERIRTVRSELEKFLNKSRFVSTDSLPYQDWGKWSDVKPKSQEMTELVHSNELMFNYYKGLAGSEGIAWIPSSKKMAVVWRSVTAPQSPAITEVKKQPKGSKVHKK